MAASFVDNGGTVCDVGCDHGKLSLYLVQRGKAKHVIATDINRQPLQKAIDLFASYDLSHTADITHVVIAGLGGHTMEAVIESAPFVKKQKTRLVLLPAQSGYQIRKYLYENGFEIEKEQTVSEKGKFYSCISAIYTGKVYQPDIYDMYIGKSGECTGDDAKGYFEMLLSQLEKKRKGFEIDNGTQNEQYESAISKIKELLK